MVHQQVADGLGAHHGVELLAVLPGAPENCSFGQQLAAFSGSGPAR